MPGKEIKLYSDDVYFGWLLSSKDSTPDLPKLSEAEIDSDVESITIVGHSSTNILDSQRTISGDSAHNLASRIAKKYKSKDKGKLKDVYLVSCEAGFSKANQRPYASMFSEDMCKLGFVGLRVHAITNRHVVRSTSSMIIESDLSLKDDKISSWCYKSFKDELEDLSLENRKCKLNKKLNDEKDKNKYTKILKEIQKIEKRQQEIRIYICKNQSYHDFMQMENNTFIDGKPAMSREVEVAIAWLKTQENATTDQQLKKFYLQIITKLTENPNKTLEEIIQILNEEYNNQTKSMQFFKTKGITENILSQIKEQLTHEINTKTTALTTYGQIKNLFIFIKWCFHSLFTYSAIDGDIHAQLENLKGLIKEYDGLKKEEKNILAKIPEQSSPKTSRLLSILGRTTTTPTLPVQYNNTSDSDEKNKLIEKMQKAQQITGQDVVKLKRLGECEKQMTVSIDKIKQALIAVIDKYLATNKANSEMKRQKIEIMKLIKNYLENQNPESWEQVERFIANPNNKKWSSGWSSKVKAIHKEVKKLSATPSPAKKGGI